MKNILRTRIQLIFKALKKEHAVILSLFFGFSVIGPLAPAWAQKKKGEDIFASTVKNREAEFYFTEGEKFFILEDYSKALLYYQRALELTPQNSTIHYKIAEVLARGNKQDDLMKAALSIEQALKLEKKNKYFYLLAANIYTSLSRFDRAAAIYETLLSEIKGTEEYLFELGAVYQYNNRVDDAIKTYTRAEAVLGINEISSIEKQKLYLKAGKTKEAFAEGEKLIKAFPGEERFVLGLSEVFSRNGYRPEAIGILERFVSNYPESLEAKVLLAGLYRDDMKEDAARALLTDLFDNPYVDLKSKLIILGTYNTEINQSRARNTRDQEKEQFAEVLYSKLLTHPGLTSDVYVVGGDLFLSLGKLENAQQEYLKAIEMGEVNFEVWENLLYLDVQRNNFDLVVSHGEEAVELFPNQGKIYYYLGYGLLRKRQFREAVAVLEQARKLISGNNQRASEVNGWLGDAFTSLKEYAKANKAYDDALVLNPQNDMVLNNYSFHLAVRKENLEKAERMSAQLIKEHPGNNMYMDTHAWVLFAREKYRDARRIMERIMESGEATATHLEHYGDILYKLGEVNEAVKQWEKAKSLNANSEILNQKIANRKIYE